MDTISIDGTGAQVLANKTEPVMLSTEKRLGEQVSVVERQAELFQIKDEAGFQAAGELTRQIKRVQKEVTDYWEPMRKTTYEAYKSVTDHKKKMLDPLEKAEKTLKRKLGDYSREQERIRREEEERLRRLAMEAMERKLGEAAEAESAGDKEAAEYAMAEAEAYEGAADVMPVKGPAVKADGISMRSNWRIIKVDPAAVPVELAGVVLRPVDEKAVLRLIKASKGQIAIPGIQYEEFADVSVRV